MLKKDLFQTNFVVWNFPKVALIVITPNNKNPDHPGGELLQPNKTAPISKVPTPLDHFNGNICEER